MGRTTREMAMRMRLEAKYLGEVRPGLLKALSLTNLHQVPRLTKIVLNSGVGEAVSNPKALENAVKDLAAITGQRPVVIRAKRSVSNFKLRKSMPIACKVTLRGKRMYAFFDRLVNVALPRVRDFRGVSRQSFDGRGNYNLGVKEQIIFPEIDYDSVDAIRGFDVTIVTSTDKDEEAYRLLKELGMPFRN